jgi:hypothetical protein
MNSKMKIISVNSENISEYQPVCFLNPKNERRDRIGTDTYLSPYRKI